MDNAEIKKFAYMEGTLQSAFYSNDFIKLPCTMHHDQLFMVSFLKLLTLVMNCFISTVCFAGIDIVN